MPPIKRIRRELRAAGYATRKRRDGHYTVRGVYPVVLTEYALRLLWRGVKERV